MYIRQNYRIYPNKEQTTTLNKWLGQARFVWNHMLSKNTEYYKDHQKFLFEYDMNSLLPKLKKEEETKWLSEIPSQCLQQKCQDLSTALKACSKNRTNRKGFPSFKSKKTDESGIRFPSFKLKEGKLFLPKINSGIKIKFHTDFKGSQGSLTVSKDRTGCFFVSVIVKIDEVPSVTKINKIVGLDVGVKEFLVSTDGETVSNPKFTKKFEKKLAKSQRKHSRKKKGSNNRNKQRIKVAKIHKDIRNLRKNFIYQTASSIAKENDLICVENLNVKGMMKNRKLSKAIADVSFGSFIESLKWQCKKRGKHIVEISKWFPSSKTCSCCGNVKGDLTLSDRVYKCDECNVSLDRDLNAAYNILNEGIKVFLTTNTAGTAEINAFGGNQVPDSDMTMYFSGQPKKLSDI